MVLNGCDGRSDTDPHRLADLVRESPKPPDGDSEDLMTPEDRAALVAAVKSRDAKALAALVSRWLEHAGSIEEISAILLEAGRLRPSNDLARAVVDGSTLTAISDRLMQASSDAAYLQALFDLEVQIPQFAETPYFLVTPPSLSPREKWPGLLRHLRLPDDVTERLLKSAFMPFDRKVFARKTLKDIGADLGLRSRHLLIDLEYGVLLFRVEGQWHNLPLMPHVAKRYQELYPGLERSPAAFFSVGAMRAHAVMAGLPVQTDPFVPFRFEVRERSQLDDFMAAFRDAISKQPHLELWLRGQNNEHLLEDFTAEAEQGICPWRNRREASLVPSLYRELSRRLSERREYAAYCVEFAKCGLEIDTRLGLRPYTGRGPADEAVSLPGDHWGVVPPMTSVAYDAAGSPTASRDHHPIYRALQKLFFLQHYNLPSSVLDLTNDLDVALFFARHTLAGGRYAKIDPQKNRPVLYMFILDRRVDRFMNSEQLAERHGMLRPLRQRCGLLAGASFVTRNDYARFIAVKFDLTGAILDDPGVPAEHLFPGPMEDAFMAQLIEFTQSAGLTRMRPLVLA
ncbi:MAG: FRG domain-containing protein [Burkholderiaceae bacterium]|nr:FRG domain-containing protein [Burkholderiaceae bacterium]